MEVSVRLWANLELDVYRNEKCLEQSLLRRLKPTCHQQYTFHKSHSFQII
jgi:hypothetical protein